MKANLETWQQDPLDPYLWVGENGLIINTAALDERSEFFETVRVLAEPAVIAELKSQSMTAAL